MIWEVKLYIEFMNTSKLRVLIGWKHVDTSEVKWNTSKLQVLIGWKHVHTSEVKWITSEVTGTMKQMRRK